LVLAALDQPRKTLAALAAATQCFQPLHQRAVVAVRLLVAADKMVQTVALVVVRLLTEQIRRERAFPVKGLLEAVVVVTMAMVRVVAVAQVLLA